MLKSPVLQTWRKESSQERWEKERDEIIEKQATSLAADIEAHQSAFEQKNLAKEFDIKKKHQELNKQMDSLAPKSSVPQVPGS